MEIQFDNHDERIKFYELMLERTQTCIRLEAGTAADS